MLHLGLDFGTTTSILSYHDGEKLRAFRLGGASASPYIPSVLSLEKADLSEQEIGHAARLNQGDADYWVYTHFKMLLAETNPEQLQRRGYQEHSPQQVALWFLQQLLSSFQRELGLSDLQQNLVLTAPEIWVREGQHAAREALQSICHDLGLPKVRLLSEPVAATVYFAHCYHEKHQQAYQGHVLVCDYGGGTLDLSLCHVADKEVTILEGTGRGDAHETLGTAGVAFDEAVVQRVLARHEAEENPRRFYRLLKAFEEQKIAQTEKLSKALERYCRNSATNKKVFEIDEMAVEADDLATVFNDLIQPALDRALQEMSICLVQHQVNTEDGKHFHVVMVGGFSNFYLVRRTVRNFFNSRTEADARFQAYFDLIDTALAISKGAALIANEDFKVHMVCPISVGIRARDRFLEETDLLLLTKGTPLQEYQQAQFTPMWLRVMSEEALDTTSLTIFLDVGSQRRRYIDLRGQLRDFIPNPNPENQWRIGFAVNENLLFSLHVLDQQGEVKVTSLGNLEEKMSGLHFSEE